MEFLLSRQGIAFSEFPLNNIFSKRLASIIMMITK